MAGGASIRSPAKREAVRLSHYVLDDGKLVVAHAGMKEEMQGRGSGRVRDFAMYGETTGETDEFGLPVRYNWAAEYRGRAIVVCGHTPVPEPEWLNRTINFDTGCVFGGKLTALRYPEKELVSVPAARVYAHSAKPLRPAADGVPALTAQQQHDDVLDIEDVMGKGYRREDLGTFGRIPSHKATLLWLLVRYAFIDKSIVVVTEGLGPQPFHGRVVLLLNQHSTSAAEMVAAFARENHLATVVGTKTPGRLLSGSLFKVGHGFVLGLPAAAYLTWEGTLLEGKGIEPDHVVELARDALKDGRDAQLEKAIEVDKQL